MKKLMLVALSIVMIFAICSCGKSSESQLYGTWELSSVIIDGSVYSLTDLESMGESMDDYDLTLVFKEGGNVLVKERDTTDSLEYSLDGETLTIGTTPATFRDGIITITYETGGSTVLEKVSDKMTLDENDNSDDENVEATEEIDEAEDEINDAEDDNTDAASGQDKDFREFMNDYENFIDEYVAFMKKYNSSSDQSSMLSDYTDMMTKYVDIIGDLDDIDQDELSEEDLKYYIQVTGRCSQKLIDAGI